MSWFGETFSAVASLMTISLYGFSCVMSAYKDGRDIPALRQSSE